MRIKSIPYFLIAALFLLICAPNLFSEGMFVDGLIYASVAQNMALGDGSFWQPHYTTTLFNHFYEHPPLAMGLQSLWYTVFGTGLWVERAYSLSTFLLTGYVMHLIWTQLKLPTNKSWIALLLWILVPSVSWACANNMLENTMMIFTCLALLFYLKSVKRKTWWFLILAGFSLSLAFLSKGFFALYLWAAPGVFWLFSKQSTFIKACIHSLTLVVFTVLPLLFCVWLWPEAYINLNTYFTKQVLGSIQSVQTVTSRFAIVGDFLSGIAPAVLLGVVLMFLTKKYKPSLKPSNLSICLTVLALAGVLPIMVSLKQRGFYILSVYPIFALALGAYLLPIVQALQANLNLHKLNTSLRTLALILIILALGVNLYFSTKVGRDKEKITLVKQSIPLVGKKSTLGLCSSLYTDWSLHAYFQRYGKINLNAKEPLMYPFALEGNSCSLPIGNAPNQELLTVGTFKLRSFTPKK